MISGYSKRTQWLSPLIRHDVDKNILIVDWFVDIVFADVSSNEMLNLNYLKLESLMSRVEHSVKALLKEAEKYDFVLIVNRETWQSSYEETYARNYKIWKDTDKELISRTNIYFLNFSESFFYNTTTPADRTLSLPWFYSNWYTGGIFHSPTFTPDIEYVEKDYTFNMLLGKENRFRRGLFDKFENRKDIYKTYFGEHKYKAVSDIHLEDDYVAHYLISKKRDEQLQTFYNLPVPYDVDFGESSRFTGHRDGPLLSHMIPEKIYKNTHFDIITETVLYDKQNMITGWTSEKTAKPLFTGRFFILFGSLRTSLYLKKFGYELDSYMLNDYDFETDWDKRMKKAEDLIDELENINYVKKVYNDTREARLHNMKVAKDGMKNSLITIQDWIMDKIE